MRMLNLFRTPYIRRLEAAEAELLELRETARHLCEVQAAHSVNARWSIDGLKYEAAELRKQVAELQKRDALVQQVGKLRGDLWSVMAGPSNTLALIASKDKEIATLKAEIRTLKRERDQAGRFTHEAP